MAALSTLNMGLLGGLLAGGGLLSLYVMVRNPGNPTAIRPHLPASRCIFGIVLVWLIPAGFNYGFSSTVHMLFMEARSWQTSVAAETCCLLLIRYLPFSLFLLLALWRVLRHPATDAGQRGFERFLAGWLIAGLLAVSLTRRQRSDTLFALWPACALLVGREMANLAERMGETRFAGVAVVIGCILIGATYNAVHSTNARNYKSLGAGKELRLAADTELAAKALKASASTPVACTTSARRKRCSFTWHLPPPHRPTQLEAIWQAQTSV